MHETISLVTLHLHRLPNASLLWSKTCINLDNYVIEFRGVGDEWAEWVLLDQLTLYQSEGADCAPLDD